MPEDRFQPGRTHRTKGLPGKGQRLAQAYQQRHHKQIGRHFEGECPPQLMAVGSREAKAQGRETTQAKSEEGKRVP